MSEPIRVLQVFGRLDRGGAETMVMNLYRRMDRNKIQFDFILHTQDECSYLEEVRSLGGRIYAVPAYSPGTAAGYRKAWKAFFTEHPEYRILHSHVRSTASLYLPLARKQGLITIIHSHNTSSGHGLKALVKTLLQYPLRRQADYLFACGREAGVWLYGRKACQSSRFYILPNAIESRRFGFDAQRRRRIREGMRIAPDTLVMGHIGRFEEQKNHRFLLEIFGKLRQREPDSLLLLIGEGPLEQEARRRAEELQVLTAVRFLGSRSDVDGLVQAMDVFVFPSLFEGLPVTLIEAQAAGLPVVASDTVTGEADLTGLVKPVSLRAGADAWAECAARQARLSRRSRAEEVAAAGYDVERTAEWLEAFYEETGRRAQGTAAAGRR